MIRPIRNNFEIESVKPEKKQGGKDGACNEKLNQVCAEGAEIFHLKSQSQDLT
jgi:hypothetical protein